MNEFQMLKTYLPRDRSQSQARRNDAGFGLVRDDVIAHRPGTLSDSRVQLNLTLSLN